MEVHEVLRKLRPILGQRVERYWLAYLSEDHEGRQELETAFRLMAAKYLGSEVETLDVPLSAPSSEISVVVRHFLPLNSASREAEGARFDEPASSR